MKTYTKTYKDLIVWQKAHTVTKEVFALLPSINRDIISQNIMNQLIRSTTSIPANIVEGYYSHRGKSFISFLEIARGSAGETDYWLFELCDNAYIKNDTYKTLTKNIDELIRMLSGLINSLRKKS